MLHDTVGGQFIEVAEEVQMMCQPTPRFGSNSPFCLLGQPHCYVHKFYTLFKVNCTVVVVVVGSVAGLPDCFIVHCTLHCIGGGGGGEMQ